MWPVLLCPQHQGLMVRVKTVVEGPRGGNSVGRRFLVVCVGEIGGGRPFVQYDVSALITSVFFSTKTNHPVGIVFVRTFPRAPRGLQVESTGSATHGSFVACASSLPRGRRDMPENGKGETHHVQGKHRPGLDESMQIAEQDGHGEKEKVRGISYVMSENLDELARDHPS